MGLCLLGAPHPELPPPTAPLPHPRQQRDSNIHTPTSFSVLLTKSYKRVCLQGRWQGCPQAGLTFEAWSMGGRGPRTPLQPVPACEYGLWLMCKNKIWGAGRVWGGGTGRVTCRHQSPSLGTPSEQAERGIPKQDLLWLQIQVSGQRQGVGAGGRGGVGLGNSGAWQRASLSFRRTDFGISWGWAWGHRAGAGALSQGSPKALAGEDGRIVGRSSWAGARQGPG